jgi:hypothetical protein
LTPAGVRGRGDPTGAYGAEEAPLYPGGKQVPGAEINSPILHSLFLTKLYNCFFDRNNQKKLSTLITKFYLLKF